VAQLPIAPHEPVRPHVDTACSTQSLSGSVPAEANAHVPVEHEWQGPAQFDPQHTPSKQNPVAHSFAAPHAAPVAFFDTHEDPAQ
jgi:hypothetical protein